MPMIDPNTETLLTLAEAARLIPPRRANRPTHLSCLYRWTVSGCRGIILESLQIGATRATSREALSRFYAALTAQTQGKAPAPTPAPAHRRRKIEAAERRLAAAGI
jgi:hypothetical protein